jgi:zinc transporter
VDTDDSGVVHDGGLVCAYLRSEGGWAPLDQARVATHGRGDGLLWVHVDRDGRWAKTYVEREAGLAPLVSRALLEEETRPRAVIMGDGLLMILRGVNLNPGADPEDMVSLRIWIEPGLIVTVRHRRVMAVQDLRDDIAAGRGPQAEGEFLVVLTGRLTQRMGSVLEALDEHEDDMEDSVVTGYRAEVRSELAKIRRQAIALRRYLAPQREALSRLLSENLSWLGTPDKHRLREVTDRLIRHVEDLDAIRERAAVIQDELGNRLAEQMNRNMYVLSIVATVMLPLGFLTGLLGINVDGMPGAQDAPLAFALVCAGLAVLVAVEVWILRRLKWI